MVLNPEQFHNSDPDQPGGTHKQWVDAISGKGTYVTMSASDALNMTSSEAPRNFVKGEYARTDWDKLESGETSLKDFVQVRHSPRLYQIKLERAKWGEPDSMYRHIQKHGIDKSYPLWAMRNPHKPDQVMLTEGHHRLIAAHAIDPDMPVHVLDEGIHQSGEHIKTRFSAYDQNRSKDDKYLQEFIKNPDIMKKNPRNSKGNLDRNIDEIQRTVKSYSLDSDNIKPTNEGAWKRDS